MYKELQGVVDNPADTFWDPASQSAYFYDGTNFWTGEDAKSIQARTDYVHCNGLAGTMLFSMYDLNDPANTLFNDVVNDLAGTTTSCTNNPPPTTTTNPTVPPTSTTTMTVPPTTTTTTTSNTVPPTTTTTTGGPGGGIVGNPGFESGTLSPWTCDAGTGSVVGSPAHSGSHALAAAASNSDDAQCTQVITVQPNHTYTLSTWVQGNFVFVGDTGTGTSDTSTFTPAAPTWQQLQVNFTTGASTTQVTIFIHGWFGQGTVLADDFSVS